MQDPLSGKAEHCSTSAEHKLSEHPAADRVNSGLQEQECRQRIKGSDCSTVFNICESVFSVLCLVLGSCFQERYTGVEGDTYVTRNRLQKDRKKWTYSAWRRPRSRENLHLSATTILGHGGREWRPILLRSSQKQKRRK